MFPWADSVLMDCPIQHDVPIPHFAAIANEEVGNCLVVVRAVGSKVRISSLLQFLTNYVLQICVGYVCNDTARSLVLPLVGVFFLSVIPVA